MKRFYDKIQIDLATQCWLWTARTDDGYGKFRVGENVRLAHRVSYEMHIGAIPEGLCLDHLCRVRSCVNPAHLEPVTLQENIARGEVSKLHRSKTHCPYGHSYSGDNLYVAPNGWRTCRECHRTQKRARRARNGR